MSVSQYSQRGELGKQTKNSLKMIEDDSVSVSEWVDNPVNNLQTCINMLTKSHTTIRKLITDLCGSRKTGWIRQN